MVGIGLGFGDSRIVLAMEIFLMGVWGGLFCRICGVFLFTYAAWVMGYGEMHLLAMIFYLLLRF